jgi:hypothetical protein
MSEHFSTLKLHGCEMLVACELSYLGMVIAIGVGRVSAEALRNAYDKVKVR